jgi:glycosyltransferase involved in cell wall biosynthesis
MKKTLVVDWLDKYGGAERVIALLHHSLNFSKINALVNIMRKEDLNKMFSNNPDIQTTSLQNTGKKFRLFFFLFPYFISKIKVDKNSNLIISSSHSVAKGVRKSNSKQIHISYFQARNANYIWEEAKLYFGFSFFLLYPLIALLRKIDKKQAQQPDYIICNSKFVQDWVKKTYNRDSTVIYPPVNLSKFNLCEDKNDYYVAVGRIVQIKRFDVLIEAFRINGKKLVLIGDGELYERFKASIPENITMTGSLSSEEVESYAKKAKAFIQVGIEGFGIAPLEAQACGTPVIAYGRGGVLETVIENQTGIFFDQQTVESLNQAIDKFEKMSFEPTLIRENALRFSEERFKTEIKQFVESKITVK